MMLTLVKSKNDKTDSSGILEASQFWDSLQVSDHCTHAC